MLPDLIRSTVEDISARMQLPIDFAAVACILTLAGSVNRRARIQPKQRDAWIVVPNLWGGIVAPPGYMKSPVIAEVLRPLADIEAAWEKAHRVEMASAASETSLEHKGALNNRITRKRLIVNDSTPEKLHELLRDNPAGLLVVRDELAGLLAELDARGREGQRAFYLSAWSGDTPHEVDRIKRGNVYVPACCLSIVGGIQPERLRKYLATIDGPNLQDDGFIQRFQLLVWPDLGTDFEYIDRPPNQRARTKLRSRYERMTAVDPEHPLMLRFSDEAQEVFIAWYEDLEFRIRRGDLGSLLAGHLSKYRSLMPSLAGLFEIASRRLGGFEGFDGGQEICRISTSNTVLAMRWCIYLEDHAHRVYGLTNTEVRAALDLLAKIRHRAIGKDGFLTAREISQAGWKWLDTPEKVRNATDVLIKAGYLRDATALVGPKGGRPSKRFEVNPWTFQLK